MNCMCYEQNSSVGTQNSAASSQNCKGSWPWPSVTSNSPAMLEMHFLHLIWQPHLTLSQNADIGLIFQTLDYYSIVFLYCSMPTLKKFFLAISVHGNQGMVIIRERLWVSQIKHVPKVYCHWRINIQWYIIKFAALPYKLSSIITISTFSFCLLPVEICLLLLFTIPSSVLSLLLLFACPSLPNMALLFLLLLFLLLWLLQTDVLSHHLQRNLIYLDSQVRTS